MFTHFSKKEKSIRYPQDRRMAIGLSKTTIIVLVLIFLLTVGIAWIQYLFFGLPADPSASLSYSPETKPQGFPAWIILSHWINFFFMIIIIRSGISILMDHPRLYWNDGCTPGTDWARFTPIKEAPTKQWTAKDDARYISPAIGLPGYRHSVGLARGWHFIHVPFFLLNGAIFITLLLLSDQWMRIVPTSWQIVPDSWKVFVHYATFNMPIEPNGFYHYNALQKLSYFIVVFVMAPISMLSGMAMSPAIENRFHWFLKMFGNRQGARSVHFLMMISYVIFIVIHVAMVLMSDAVRNLNHITLGTDSPTILTGSYIVGGIILFTIAFQFLAHWVSWNRPRWLQKTDAFINGNLWRNSLNKLKPKRFHTKEDITPYFWKNGKLPSSEKWHKMLEENFKNYKLKVGGMVENPMELSIDEMKEIAREETITMHHCVQGWTGIAEWAGFPLKRLIEMVKPAPTATTVVFYSFGEGLYGGVYYDTQTLENCMKPASILAWEMNYEQLPVDHGAPLRLRVENQLGYKMVKWIERIEFVESYEDVGKGFGGKNEDDEFYDFLANT